MAENYLIDQVKMMRTTSRSFKRIHYLLVFAERVYIQNMRESFKKDLKQEFELLSLTEYENLIIENLIYWQCYQLLFLRYQNLNINNTKSEA